jgi:thiol-disulfide isomerase/thioredoxin
MHHERSVVSLALCAIVSCAQPLCVGCEHKTSPGGPRAGSVPAANDASTPAQTDAARARFHKSLPFESVPRILPQPEPEPATNDERFRAPEVSPPLPSNMRVVLGSEVVQSTRDPNRKATLVNVWATWCGSCQEEMPMLLSLRQRYASRGIEVVFVSVDEPKLAATVQSTLQALGAAGPTLIAHPELGYFKRALSPIWRGALPSTFLYDNQGRLRYFWGAQAAESEVVPVIEGLLAGKPIDGMANFAVTGGGTP